jgi:hypothetical protein
MPKNFNAFRHVALGYVLIVGLAIGLITPIVQAEAPHDTLYTTENSIVDGLTQAERAAKIDQLFLSRGNPLAGYGLAMVQAADKYELNWKLLPALSIIESNGGSMLCKNPKGAWNPFGYGSCKIAFTDFNHAIDVVAKNLGGHNPATEKYYKDKTIEQIIDAYNPPSIRHDYRQLVTWAMNKIESTEIPTSSKQLAMNK